MELYIHIPFCVKKCEYCDFLSGPADEERKKAYIEALLSEIRGIPSLERDSREVTSVFFGGGNPSLIERSEIERVL